MVNFDEYKKKFFLACQKERRSEKFYFKCLSYAQRLTEKSLPLIYDPKHFSLLVGYDLYYIYAVSNNSKKFYTHFSIPKKNGSERKISAPYPSLLEIQNWILKNILDNIPVSIYAKAYRKGLSIIDNARFHRKQSKVLRVDIKNFFPSISIDQIYNIFKNLGYSKSLSRLLAGLCTLRGGLPQGAPTSPALSNIFFRPIDARLGAFARSLGIRYSRYADDLFFSGDFDMHSTLHFVKKIIGEYNLEVNQNKTSIMRRGSRQQVTGVITNNFLNAPRELRRDLLQRAYYIEKFGLDDYLLHENITAPNYIYTLIGKAYHVKFLNKRTPKIDWIISVFKSALPE